MSKYIITRDNNSDSLTHYGVKGMKWGKKKSRSFRDLTSEERAAFDKSMLNSGYYKNKEGNYQRDYAVTGSPIARQIQTQNGKIKLKAASQNMLKSMQSKNNKRLKNRGKVLLLKMKTKRQAKKAVKRIKFNNSLPVSIYKAVKNF